MGIRIPEDMSIVGFDNISYGALSNPKLTTIDQHAEQMGALAMRMMLDQIADPERQQSSIQLAPELVIRDSVARPK